MLQFFQYKARNHQRAVNEAGLADVGDTAIDDSAGVQQNLIGDFAILFRPAFAVVAFAAIAAVFGLFKVAAVAFASIAVVAFALLALGGAALAHGPEAAEEMSQVLFTQDGGGDAQIAKEQCPYQWQDGVQVQEREQRERERE